MTFRHTKPFRAKSRLVSKRKTTVPVSPDPVHPLHQLHQSYTRLADRLAAQSQLDWATWLRQRALLLLLAAVAAMLVSLILTRVRPSAIADIGLPQSYFAFLLPIALLSFAIGRLFVTNRHAITISLFSTAVCFFQLHAVRVPALFIIGFFVLMLVIELGILLVKKR